LGNPADPCRRQSAHVVIVGAGFGGSIGRGRTTTISASLITRQDTRLFAASAHRNHN
jgi:hypothetical protein